jgi:glycosyltransferase involved in cell wall biosynthesis
MVSKDKAKISIMIPIFNEAHHLPKLINNLKTLTPNIFIVDSQSTDESIDIAINQGCKVFQWNPPGESWVESNFADKLNWGIALNPFNSEWIMRVDADELIDPDLAKEINSFINTNTSAQFDACSIKKNFFYLGKHIKFGGYSNKFETRLFRANNIIRFENRRLDERVIGMQALRVMSGAINERSNTSVQHWFQKHVHYSRAEARMFLFEKRSPNQLSQLNKSIRIKRFLIENLFNRVPLFIRAFAYFLYRYFFLLGFLDGRRGFLFHFSHAFIYRFIVDMLIFEYKHDIYDNLTK